MALRTAARLTTGVCGLALAVTPIATAGGARPRATPGRDSRPCARQIPRGAAFFARMVEGRTDGWLAGDLPASVDLRDGRVLWLFNDTWVGRRLPDGSFAPGTTLWHNSALVQTGACVDFVGAGGTGWLTIPATPDWWWPTAGVLRRTGRGAVVDVFVDRMHRTGPGTFDFTPVGADVVELRARDLAVRGSIHFSGARRGERSLRALDVLDRSSMVDRSEPRRRRSHLPPLQQSADDPARPRSLARSCEGP